MKKLLLASAISISYPTFATDRGEVLYQQCLEQAGTSSETAKATCADKASDLYKKYITEYYLDIFDRFQKTNPVIASNFENAQKEWIANRNKECKTKDNPSLCLMQQNEQRAHELETMKDNLSLADEMAEKDNNPNEVITHEKVKRVYIFDKREIVETPDGYGPYAVTYSFSTVTTGIQWLDNFLLAPYGEKKTTREEVKKEMEEDFQEYIANIGGISEHWNKSSITFDEQKHHIAVFTNHIEQYFGGNYIIDAYHKLYIDLEKKLLLSLDSLFTPSNLAQAKELLWNTFQNSEQGKEFTIEKSDFEISGDFEFTPDGLEFKYGQGSLLPSVFGPVSYTIPNEKIELLLKPEYRFLLMYDI